MKKENNRIQLTCEHCKYTWETKSKLQLVSCPSCGYKVKNINYEQEVSE